MRVMRIASVNVGVVAELFDGQSGARRIMTGIRKRPLAGPVQVNRLGLAGDEQADLTVHGGLDKAVYAYPAEHYAFWVAQRAAAHRGAEPLPPGAMGENLTLEGILESDIWIGDRLCIGAVLLEVTQPRQPCFKFDARMGFSHASKRMLQSGFSGFYLRVLQTGTVQAGDAVELLPGPRRTTLASVNELRLKGRQRDLF